MRTPSNSKDRRFFSLKWRTLIRISLVLIVVNSILSFLTYANLQAQFEEQLSSSVKNYSAARLDQSRSQLVENGNSIIIASQTQTEGKLTEFGLHQYLEANWELFQIVWGIEAAVIYNQNNEQEKVWGNTENSPKLDKFVSSVRNSLEPATITLCRNECRLYAAIPLVFENTEIKTLLLSTTMLDFIVAFSQQSGFGVALLRKGEIDSNISEGKHWGLNITAITQRNENSPLIDQLAKKTTLNDFLENGISLETTPQVYHYFYAVKLDSERDSDHNFIVIVSDISAQVSKIFNNLIETILLTLAGLLISVLALLLVLKKPIARIQALASLLPLLARSGFKEIRSRLSNFSHSDMFIDELDILDETTEKLTYQLEKMETEIDKRTNELEYMALYDTLTGLANRRFFTDQLENLVDNFKSHGERFAVVFIDLDNFKDINDTLGHDAGDELLIEVSKRLTQNVRSTDIVARLGGDEFTLLLPQIKESQNVADVMKKVLDAFQVTVDLMGTGIKVTPSIGVSMCPDNGLEAQELMRCADVAMYQAKQEGKNTYHFYNEQMNEEAQSLIRLKN